MRVNKNDWLVLGIVIWMAAVSFCIVDLYAYRTFILGELGDIYEMIADVYHHITSLLEMGVLL